MLNIFYIKYAVKKDANNLVTAMSCDVELDKDIVVHR